MNQIDKLFMTLQKFLTGAAGVDKSIAREDVLLICWI